MIHTKTKILAGVLVLLLGAYSIEPEPMIADKMPEIVGVSKDTITRFELTQLGQKLRFEKENGIWMIKAPFEAKADQARVKALLLQFRKPISMDVMLERGEEKQYGLDASHSIVVELWGSEERPIISFALGYDGTPSSSFVRLSGDNAVYRARIGGRHRFDYPHEQWKNQLIFDFQEPEVSQLDVKSQLVQYSIKKELGVWGMDPDPGWKLDQDKTKTLMSRLGSLRIGRVQKEPLTQANLALRVSFSDRPQLEAQIGLGEYAQVAIGAEVYQTSISMFSSLASNPSLLRDKRILRFNSRTELDTITYRGYQQEIVLQQDLSNGFWRVLRPTGMGIDLKAVFYMVNTLSQADVLDFVQHEEGWTSVVSLELRMLNGAISVLQIGAGTPQGVPAQLGSRQFILDTKLVEKIYRAFSQEMK